MDREILSQYADLREEIRDLQKRISQTEKKIEKLTEKGCLVSDTVSGTRRDGTIGPIRITGFPSRDYNRQRHLLESRQHMLGAKEQELLELVNEVEKFIEAIEDSRIRRIFRYRYLDNMSWPQVAIQMRGNHTADSCRKTHDRYLEEK